MNLTKTWMKRVAPALLAAAVVIPTAQAAGVGTTGGDRPAGGYSHLQELTAMANRYKAQVSGIATTSAGYSHLQELTAMANRYKAQVSRLAATPSGNSHLQDLTAMADRYKAQVSRVAPLPPGYSHLQELTAMDNAYKAHAIAGVRMPASTAAGGFDWADAGIGAMSGFAAALALAGTLVLVLRRRVRGQGPRTPTTA